MALDVSKVVSRHGMVGDLSSVIDIRMKEGTTRRFTEKAASVSIASQSYSGRARLKR